MKLHGSLQDNLESAILSARRHRHKPVYPDTLQHWRALASYTRHELSAKADPQYAVLAQLARELEAEIDARETGTA